MKKRLSIFLIFVLLFSLSSTTVASALPNKSELPGLYAAEDGDMFIFTIRRPRCDDNYK